RPYWWFLSLVAGGLTTLAFAPFDLSWLIFFTLAVSFYFWNRLPTKQAAINAWLFGLGLQCTGVSWIYYSLHVHGSAPVIFAVLLIFLLCCYLSLYTALSVYTVNRFLPDNPVLRFLLFYPASWVVFEWLQGYVMTGFSWMQLGYTQIDMPLSGYAPVLGNHAVGGLIAFTAGAIALLVNSSIQLKSRAGFAILALLLIIWLSGGLAKTVSWTEAEGDALKVSVIQGNIPQKDKWQPTMRQLTMERYRDLSLAQKDVDLIVWPETAVPNYWHRVVPYIRQLEEEMKARDAELLLGIFVKDDDKRPLNSVLSVNGGLYSKRHLVPLGEYIPLRFLIEFFNHFVKIPMSDIASGDEDQPLLTVHGIPLAVSI
ncbi:MAG: apolipoprotein N-acyltransferase, partial [Gammaproteobacteria bacterium]|nr:apolipoprotein N-acyltransferase [Gammaproteobacteria bacterium]